MCVPRKLGKRTSGIFVVLFWQLISAQVKWMVQLMLPYPFSIPNDGVKVMWWSMICLYRNAVWWPQSWRSKTAAMLILGDLHSWGRISVFHLCPLADSLIGAWEATSQSHRYPSSSFRHVLRTFVSEYKSFHIFILIYCFFNNPCLIRDLDVWASRFLKEWKVDKCTLCLSIHPSVREASWLIYPSSSVAPISLHWQIEMHLLDKIYMAN